MSYLSNEMMAEINLDSCLLNYISNTASFLDIENPDVESIVRNFEMLNVKFVGINPQQADTELLRQVYIHNMYVINLQNIKMWLQLYYMISIIPETEGKILSIVFNTNGVVMSASIPNITITAKSSISVNPLLFFIFYTPINIH